MRFALALWLGLAASSAVGADFVIRGATLHDGTGDPARQADVAVEGDTIVAVGKFDGVADAEYSGEGLILAPGFIDLHSHSDHPILRAETRDNLNFAMQGVTTIVTGNCGSGHVDVVRYFRDLNQAGAGTNVMHLMPHGSVRRQVLGEAERPCTPGELEQMKQLVERGMEAGACGLASGLIYVPGSFAETAELVALAEVAGARHGIYASHIRNEASRLLEAIDEALEIGRGAGVPVHISHFKASGQANWGLAADAVAKLRAARAKGQRVTADQYPYIASSTSLGAMVVPQSYRAGDRFQKALADSKQRETLRAAVERSVADRNGGASLMIAHFAPRPQWNGLTLDKVALQQDVAVADLVIDIERQGGAQMISFSMSEEAVRLMMREPFVATASDGAARNVDGDEQPHPRNFGCFPRKIGWYAIQQQVLPLPLAIRSASGLPADILGLRRRGYVKVGAKADLVVFDPKAFRDQATFTEPKQLATGVRHLWVNGQLTVRDGKPTHALPGRALRLADERAEAP